MQTLERTKQKTMGETKSHVTTLKHKVRTNIGECMRANAPAINAQNKQKRECAIEADVKQTKSTQTRANRATYKSAVVSQRPSDVRSPAPVDDVKACTRAF